MRWRSMGSIFITSAIIRARAMCCSFLQSGKTQNVQVQFSVVNGSGGSSNTTRAKPHEFFDHTIMLVERRLMAHVTALGEAHELLDSSVSEVTGAVTETLMQAGIGRSEARGQALAALGSYLRQ